MKPDTTSTIKLIYLPSVSTGILEEASRVLEATDGYSAELTEDRDIFVTTRKTRYSRLGSASVMEKIREVLRMNHLPLPSAIVISVPTSNERKCASCIHYSEGLRCCMPPTDYPERKDSDELPCDKYVRRSMYDNDVAYPLASMFLSSVSPRFRKSADAIIHDERLMDLFVENTAINLEDNADDEDYGLRDAFSEAFEAMVGGAL